MVSVDLDQTIWVYASITPTWAYGITPHLLALSCLLACVAALWSTRKQYVCTLLLRAGPIAGCSAVLAVRRYCSVAFGTWFVPSWCSGEEKQVKNKSFVVCYSFLRGHMASRADDTASFCLQEEHLPSSHVYFAVGTLHCHDLD